MLDNYTRSSHFNIGIKTSTDNTVCYFKEEKSSQNKTLNKKFTILLIFCWGTFYSDINVDVSNS